MRKLPRVEKQCHYCGKRFQVIVTKNERTKFCSIACIGKNKKGIGNIYYPEYRIWEGIKSRCLNKNHPSWKWYGGKGISICEEWMHDFHAFLRHIGPRPSMKHSVDRIDNTGHYEPGNVRWVLPIVQHNNVSSNVIISFNGKSMTISEWARHLGIKKVTLGTRLTTYEWEPERALTTPVQKRNRDYSKTKRVRL